MTQTVVVTASVGERASLYTPAPAALVAGVKYIAFVDRPMKHDIWQCVRVSRQHEDPCRDAKRYKILLNQYVDADRSLWVDRHCRLLVNPVELFDAMPGDLGLIKHYRRDVYHEARACRAKAKDDAYKIAQTVDWLRLEGWPPASGVWCGGLIARFHNAETERFSRLWWKYVEWTSRRDQLSLPVAIKRSGVLLTDLANLRTQHLIRIHAR